MTEISHPGRREFYEAESCGQSLESTAIVMSQTNVFANRVSLCSAQSLSLCLALSPWLGHSRILQNWQSHQPIHAEAEVVSQRKYRCSYQKREWMPSRKIQVRQDETIETLLLINDYPSFISYDGSLKTRLSPTLTWFSLLYLCAPMRSSLFICQKSVFQRPTTSKLPESMSSVHMMPSCSLFWAGEAGLRISSLI